LKFSAVPQAVGASEDVQLILLFVILALIIVITFLARYLVIRKVRRMMMASSDNQRTDSLPELNAREVPAGNRPNFVEFNASSVLPDAVELREKLIRRAQSQFGRVFLFDLAAAAGYIFSPVIALPFAFLSLVRFIAFRQQFRAHQRGIAGFLRPILKIWLVIASPQFRIYITAIALVMAAVQVVANPFLLLSIAFHLVLINRQVSSFRETPNMKLLVLRIFGNNENARFTFEALLKYWQYFGSFFTVVDPTFLRSQVSQRNRLIPLLMAAFVGLSLIAYEPEIFGVSAAAILGFVVLPVVLLIGAAFIAFSLRRIDQHFVKSRSDLQEQLQRLEARPRRFDLAFKELSTLCYANTWKMAVSEFVNISDVILMDLRGYSEARKGIEYEVDYILDTVPLDRIAFLVESPGLPLVRKLILSRWEYLRTTSPNLATQAPKVFVYVSSKQNPKDVQGILDILLESAINFGVEGVN